jgi:hypothetical protein
MVAVENRSKNGATITTSYFLLMISIYYNKMI